MFMIRAYMSDFNTYFTRNRLYALTPWDVERIIVRSGSGALFH